MPTPSLQTSRDSSYLLNGRGGLPCFYVQEHVAREAFNEEWVFMRILVEFRFWTVFGNRAQGTAHWWILGLGGFLENVHRVRRIRVDFKFWRVFGKREQGAAHTGGC